MQVQSFCLIWLKNLYHSTHKKPTENIYPKQQCMLYAAYSLPPCSYSNSFLSSSDIPHKRIGEQGKMPNNKVSLQFRFPERTLQSYSYKIGWQLHQNLSPFDPPDSSLHCCWESPPFIHPSVAPRQIPFASCSYMFNFSFLPLTWQSIRLHTNPMWSEQEKQACTTF